MSFVVGKTPLNWGLSHHSVTSFPSYTLPFVVLSEGPMTLSTSKQGGLCGLRCGHAVQQKADDTLM